MELQITNSELRLANRNDKPTVVKILMESFKHDPHINWLIEKSTNQNKLEIMLNYVVDETFNKGTIYLTNNNLGVTLWQSPKKEKFTVEFIKRNVSFLLKLGLPTVIRSLKSVKLTHDHFPSKQPYYYLYFIGVLPQSQGKGLSGKLMNPVLESCKLNNIPVFLETANPHNVEIYKRKGFVLTDSYTTGSTSIHYMKIANRV